MFVLFGCVEFYLSHVLTKFLIVGRALCTKNQSHVYHLDCEKSISEHDLDLDCAKIANQSHEYYLECGLSQTRAMCNIWNICSIHHGRVKEFASK